MRLVPWGIGLHSGALLSTFEEVKTNSRLCLLDGFTDKEFLINKLRQ